MSSTLTYTLRAPYYVDLDFRCRAEDATLFGNTWLRGAVLCQLHERHATRSRLNFLGRTKTGRTKQWIAADAPAWSRRLQRRRHLPAR